MIKIFIGDIGNYLSEEALRDNSSSKIILPSTSDQLSEGIYYASLGDFGKESDLFYHFISQADIIVYSQPDQWSNFDTKIETEKLLSELSTRIPIDNYTINLQPIPSFITQVADTRNSDNNQIWVAGCSISHGTGVKNEQRYGQIIADKIKLPVSFLTSRGTSIFWAASQIYKSDIKAGDVLIWGLTSIQRFFQFSEKGINHIGPGWRLSTDVTAHLRAPEFDDSKVNLNRLDDIDIIYQSINSIIDIERYCEKNHIKLILADLFQENLIQWFGGRNHYISLDTRSHYFDLGDDNKHPGPLTHKWYADCILKKYFNRELDFVATKHN